MSRESFWHLHGLIEDDTIFISSGRRPQRPVAEQLAAFLMYCGGTPHVVAASICCIADGTTYLYNSRVRTAIMRIRDKHLAWPGPRRRAFLKNEMADFGFPGCIGMIDASLIPLAEKPAKDGWAYFTRKKNYAVCDINIMICHSNFFIACTSNYM